jgi:hypothetical protein
VLSRVQRFQQQLARLDTLDPGSPDSVRQIYLMSADFRACSLLFLRLLAWTVPVSACLYLARLDSAHSSHAETYAWFWTVAYMRGVLPAGLLLLLWSTAACVCFYYIMLIPASRDITLSRGAAGCDSGGGAGTSLARQDQALQHEEDEEEEIEEGTARSGLMTALALLLNTAVTVTVNSLFIYSTQQALSAPLHLAVQLLLAVFRLVYTHVSLPLLAQFVKKPSENIRFRLKLLMMNNLLFPFVATFLTSPACFQVNNWLRACGVASFFSIVCVFCT